MDVQDIFEMLTDSGHPNGDNPDPHGAYEKVLRTFNAHFLPKVNIP